MPYSIQLTEQIPNDPPQMGAKRTTTSNHPSTPPWDKMTYLLWAVKHLPPSTITRIGQGATYIIYGEQVLQKSSQNYSYICPKLCAGCA